jgi:hypothetical protein
MKPQGFGQMGGGNLEDLGWNDMGFEPPKPVETSRDADHDAFGEDIVEHPRAAHPTGLTPVQSPVHSQQAEIEDRFSADDEPDEESDETAELLEPQAEAPAPAPVQSLPDQAAPKRAPQARSAPGSKAKAAFTLRLDPDRHLKLRLACAVGGRSAQQLVTDALDQLLAGMPELEAMAEKAKRKG